ncbi:hypothetical protein EON65_36820 [archaeon]|nr:MAG: hypothetical protein EON65_36820 [archaeon]
MQFDSALIQAQLSLTSHYCRFIRPPVACHKPTGISRLVMSNKAPIAPKMLKGGGGILASSMDTDISKQRSDIERILQDVQLVTNRIAEARGESVSPAATSSMTTDSLKGSPFVSGLRALAESERRSDLKMTQMQALLDKVTEYDRIILSKTAPPETSNLRRKSLGADLHSLPAHLRIIDRLMDLYTQSKRVTVIRTTDNNAPEDRKPSSSTAESESSREDKMLIESLKTSLAKANARVEDSEKRLIAADTEKSKFQLTINALKRETDDLKAQHEKETTDLSAELQAMRDREGQHASEEKNTLVALQLRLEKEVSLSESVLRTLHSKTAGIAKGMIQQEYTHLSADYAKAFGALDMSLVSYTSSLVRERDLLLSVKEVLEGEVSSQICQKDILQSDLQTIASEYEAMKVAYDSLSYEAATSAKNHKEIEKLRHHIQDLEGEVSKHNRKQSTESVQMGEMLNALEEQVRLLNAENVKLASELSSSKEEVVQYKKLVESYKDKLRKASNKDFMDTFEEVMQEEMMTMKNAFEAKLKAAREEADLLSKKHAQEMARMQGSRNSSFAALATLKDVMSVGTGIGGVSMSK